MHEIFTLTHTQYFVQTLSCLRSLFHWEVPNKWTMQALQGLARHVKEHDRRINLFLKGKMLL
jgi:hypothetical protein